MSVCMYVVRVYVCMSGVVYVHLCNTGATRWVLCCAERTQRVSQSVMSVQSVCTYSTYAHRNTLTCLSVP